VSAGNVEVVRRWLQTEVDAWEGATPEEVRHTSAEFWHRDADYCPIRNFPEARPCHGLGEISDFYVRFLEAWSGLAFQIRQILAVGDDRVLVCSTIRTSGQASGMKLEGDLYRSVWLREGRLIRVEDHTTLRGALRALGLEGDTLEAAGLVGAQHEGK
jgi:hypothetical protein